MLRCRTPGATHVPRRSAMHRDAPRGHGAAQPPPRARRCLGFPAAAQPAGAAAQRQRPRGDSAELPGGPRHGRAVGHCRGHRARTRPAPQLTVTVTAARAPRGSKGGTTALRGGLSVWPFQDWGGDGRGSHRAASSGIVAPQPPRHSALPADKGPACARSDRSRKVGRPRDNGGGDGGAQPSAPTPTPGAAAGRAPSPPGPNRGESPTGHSAAAAITARGAGPGSAGGGGGAWDPPIAAAGPIGDSTAEEGVGGAEGFPHAQRAAHGVGGSDVPGRGAAGGPPAHRSAQQWVGTAHTRHPLPPRPPRAPHAALSTARTAPTRCGPPCAEPLPLSPPSAVPGAPHSAHPAHSALPPPARPPPHSALPPPTPRSGSRYVQRPEAPQCGARRGAVRGGGGHCGSRQPRPGPQQSMRGRGPGGGSPATSAPSNIGPAAPGAAAPPAHRPPPPGLSPRGAPRRAAMAPPVRRRRGGGRGVGGVVRKAQPRGSAAPVRPTERRPQP